MLRRTQCRTSSEAAGADKGRETEASTPLALTLEGLGPETGRCCIQLLSAECLHHSSTGPQILS